MSDEPSKCAACFDKEDHKVEKPEICSLCGIQYKGNCASINLEFPLDDKGDKMDALCRKCAQMKCYKCGGKPAWDDNHPLRHIDDHTKVWCQACFDATDFCVGPSVVGGKMCGEPAYLKCLNCKQFVCKSCADDHKLVMFRIGWSKEVNDIYGDLDVATLKFTNMLKAHGEGYMEARWSHCDCLIHKGCDCESCFNTCIICEKCENLLGDDADFKGEICDGCGNSYCTSCVIFTDDKCDTADRNIIKCEACLSA
jgi:hypothetical protein